MSGATTILGPSPPWSPRRKSGSSLGHWRMKRDPAFAGMTMQCGATRSLTLPRCIRTPTVLLRQVHLQGCLLVCRVIERLFVLCQVIADARLRNIEIRRQIGIQKTRPLEFEEARKVEQFI